MSELLVAFKRRNVVDLIHVSRTSSRPQSPSLVSRFFDPQPRACICIYLILQGQSMTGMYRSCSRLDLKWCQTRSTVREGRHVGGDVQHSFLSN